MEENGVGSRRLRIVVSGVERREDAGEGVGRVQGHGSELRRRVEACV